MVLDAVGLEGAGLDAAGWLAGAGLLAAGALLDWTGAAAGDEAEGCDWTAVRPAT